MKKLQLLFVPIILAILLGGCGKDDVNKGIETSMSEDIPHFEYTNQNEEDFGTSDLEGKWWIADFIFTNCTSVCLPMTTNMAVLQEKLKEEDIDVELVSFSVDPDYDTPEVLNAYSKQYDADLDNWNFLTGYDFQTVKELSIKSFRSLIQEPEEGDDQVLHGTSFFLVNPEGELIKNYSGLDVEVMDEIVADLKLTK